MKKAIFILLIFFFIPQVLGADLIVTKQNARYRGKVIKITDKGFVVKTVEGTVIVLPKDQIYKIYREDKTILDFVEGTRYYIQVKRPFLPFVFLGIAAGAYAVNKFQDYQLHHRQAEDEKIQNAGPDYQNLNDQSKRDLAWCIVSGLFSAGSFYVAFRPMEVKVPLGRINVSTTSNGVTVALHF